MTTVSRVRSACHTLLAAGQLAGRKVARFPLKVPKRTSWGKVELAAEPPRLSPMRHVSGPAEQTVKKQPRPFTLQLRRVGQVGLSDEDGLKRYSDLQIFLLPCSVCEALHQAIKKCDLPQAFFVGLRRKVQARSSLGSVGSPQRKTPKLIASAW